MAVEARFQCTHTVEDTVYFQATAEDQDWSEFTPDGHLEMHITNPNAFDYFKPDTVYKLVLEEVKE